MIEVQILAEADLPVVTAAFPEKGARPSNRHVDRFAQQALGQITCLVAWDAQLAVGHVFVRWPSLASDLTRQARTLGCAEVGDLFVAARALYRSAGYRDSGLGTFVSGYTYHDAAGRPHRDEEMYCYLVKTLTTR